MVWDIDFDIEYTYINLNLFLDLIFELFLFISTHLSFSVYFCSIVVDLALVLVQVHVVHLVFQL